MAGRQGPPGVGADSLRAVLDSVFTARPYQWVEPANPFAFLGRWWQALTGWLRALEQSHPQLFWVLFWVLIALLAAIFLHAGWVMLQTLRAARAPADGGPVVAPTVRGPAWYREEARRLAGAGRYAEAMQADFLALVLDLDARRVVRFHPSKTPNEYTYEADLAGPGAEAFRGLVRRLYGYAFAGWPCGAEEYHAWRAAATAEQYAPAR